MNMDHNLNPPEPADLWCEQCEESWEDCKCGTEKHWVERDRTYLREAGADRAYEDSADDQD